MAVTEGVALVVAGVVGTPEVGSVIAPVVGTLDVVLVLVPATGLSEPSFPHAVKVLSAMIAQNTQRQDSLPPTRYHSISPIRFAGRLRHGVNASLRS